MRYLYYESLKLHTNVGNQHVAVPVVKSSLSHNLSGAAHYTTVHHQQHAFELQKERIFCYVAF